MLLVKCHIYSRKRNAICLTGIRAFSGFGVRACGYGKYLRIFEAKWKIQPACYTFLTHTTTRNTTLYIFTTWIYWDIVSNAMLALLPFTTYVNFLSSREIPFSIHLSSSGGPASLHRNKFNQSTHTYMGYGLFEWGTMSVQLCIA